MKKLLTAIIALLFILFYCSSCGPSYHLKRAQYHIKKAEGKGAVWSRDTLFKKLKFTVPGINVKFKTQILSTDKPMIFVKDSVRTEVIFIKGKDGRIDSVAVNTDCPPQTVEKDVATAINNKLESGHSFWYDIGIALVAALAGAGLVALFRRS
jgi:hypothetical protein